MRYVIFGNASILDYDYIFPYITSDTFIICCDGGIRHTYNINLSPNLIMGDFDSSDSKILNFYKESGVNIYIYPKEKNDTDMALAIDYAIKQNASEIYIFGATGNRLDHTFSNINLLINAEINQIPAFIIDSNNIIQVFSENSEKRNFLGKKGDLLSLIPINGSVTGVTTSGLYYPLDNAVIHAQQSLGISNIFINSEASVSIKTGFLLVILSKD